MSDCRNQIPTGGFYKKNNEGEKSILETVKFCDEHIAGARLPGFLQTVWAPYHRRQQEKYFKSH